VWRVLHDRSGVSRWALRDATRGKEGRDEVLGFASLQRRQSCAPATMLLCLK
jgi:hypothetical protein